MRAIYEVGGYLDFAITLPDDRARGKSGRVYIDEFCDSHNIELFKSQNVNDDACVDYLRSRHTDILFVIGWSQIAGPRVLNSTRLAIGMHPTLLPQGRGRAAIPWAILNGLKHTGVTMFVLDEGVDSGPILAQTKLLLSQDENATQLYSRVTDAHVDLIRTTWPAVISRTLRPIPQDDRLASVWPGRTPSDGELRTDMTVDQVDRLVRATTHPYPGAFLRTGGRTLRIWSGKIARETSASSNVLRLSFSDGVYDATDWHEE